MNDPHTPPHECLPETDATSVTQPTPPEKGGALSTLFDMLETFVWALAAVFLVFLFFLRLCQVDGSSMENTLYHGELLILQSFAYTPEQDDIIVFHMTDPSVNLEKTLVKRVIATGNQELTINFLTNEIYVDGIRYEDSHAVLKDAADQITGTYTLTAQHHYNPDTGILSLTVPEGSLFVLGDNRNFSKDSRTLDIGFVDERSVLGRVILRIYPFTDFT